MLCRLAELPTTVLIDLFCMIYLGVRVIRSSSREYKLEAKLNVTLALAAKMCRLLANRIYMKLAHTTIPPTLEKYQKVLSTATTTSIDNAATNSQNAVQQTHLQTSQPVSVRSRVMTIDRC